ncbi:MAG: Glycine cleavage system transcriptional antiactivator GcvR [uncultured Solirubrobacterales bacterium]|uniref:Glycine cleavage system transcriptional antiactivator GcvR n=1 Tax=uncultured Solirubrobacterales bacterium TaxID=768556 RepID=A0A6J4T919_9ACTN|nr:MAG: Glycine cleavage system transcriptional antiactivator GcvR [uncultured Solirubrobacterales bacterium]
MRPLALAALGRDRPGIVAAVTGVLVAHHVNVEDSRMAILRGEFAMVLVLAGPAELELAGLDDDLGRVREELGLEALSLTELSDQVESPGASAATHIVSVYGADHPGIVHAVAAAVSEHGVNITDLTTRLVDAPQAEPLYAMALELAVAGEDEAAVLEGALAEVGRAQGVEVSFRALERDAL